MSASDGSTADYYELPAGATELQDLISHRNMNHCDGVLFNLCYDHAKADSLSARLKIAKEMVEHARYEVSRLENMQPLQDRKEH